MADDQEIDGRTPHAPGGPTVRQGLTALIPDLRGFARFLTRDASMADDLVQDTIVRALASQQQFVQGTNLKAWLFTIQRNAFYEQARRRSREREIVHGLEQDVGAGVTVSIALQGTEQMLNLNGMLWQLTGAFREALILVGAMELSYEEAAQICGVAVGTVKARVSRARAQLAEIAGGNFWDDKKEI